MYDDSTSTEGEPEAPKPRFGLIGSFTGDEAPSGSQDEPPAPSDAGVFGLAGRIFRIGYAGRGRGGPRM